MLKDVLILAFQVIGFILSMLGFFIGIPLLFDLHSNVGLLGIIAILAMIGSYVAVVISTTRNKGI